MTGGVGTGYTLGGVGYYRKTFALPEGLLGASQKAFVRFDGVYMNSDVWLNGQA
jgi:beta-galactosidase